MVGIIKSFSRQHGYGFIEAGDKDLYFHVKDWQSSGSPFVGDEVQLAAFKTPKGYKAKKVRRIDGKN